MSIWSGREAKHSLLKVKTNMGYGGINKRRGIIQKERRDLGKAKAHDA